MAWSDPVRSGLCEQKRERIQFESAAFVLGECVLTAPLCTVGYLQIQLEGCWNQQTKQSSEWVKRPTAHTNTKSCADDDNRAFLVAADAAIGQKYANKKFRFCTDWFVYEINVYGECGVIDFVALRGAQVRSACVVFRALCMWNNNNSKSRVECLVLTLEPWDSCKQVSFHSICIFFNFSFVLRCKATEEEERRKKSEEIFIYFSDSTKIIKLWAGWVWPHRVSVYRYIGKGIPTFILNHLSQRQLVGGVCFLFRSSQPVGNQLTNSVDPACSMRAQAQCEIPN